MNTTILMVSAVAVMLALTGVLVSGTSVEQAAAVVDVSMSNTTTPAGDVQQAITTPAPTAVPIIAPVPVVKPEPRPTCIVIPAVPVPTFPPSNGSQEYPPVPPTPDVEMIRK